jgi:hypothetical protein
MNGVGARLVKAPGALTEHGGVAALKCNSQGTDEEPLNHKCRGTSKLSIADTGGNTTDKLLEVLAKSSS